MSKAVIGRTREESSPSWPARTAAPPGAPNVVVILMDDMGWSDPGCYGSEIDTPNIDALAARGVRMTHYTTHPLCSPARAALLTGCNAHAVGSGWLANHPSGYPGYVGEIPLEAATLPETLRAAGYETIMVGKWHNTPVADTVPGGAKHNWPAQRGFDTFYGFMGGETHHFFPSRLMHGNVVLPIDDYPDDYYAGDDWMTQALRFVQELRESRADKPFFLYVANTAMHSPLQAKAVDLAKYRGRYDAGWTTVRAARFERQVALGLVPPGTRLPVSDPRAPAWETTDPRDRPLYARHMEAYAAMMDNADQNVGRLVAFLAERGELDRTLIVFTSDNGGTDAGGAHGAHNLNRLYAGLPARPVDDERVRASLLGGQQSAALYPTAWGEVSNTPFPAFKTHTGAGGRRVSMIVSWPARIPARGAVRTQFMHVTDVMPTVLALAGVPPLAMLRGASAKTMDGRDCAAVLVDDAPSPRHEQYYECWSNRAFFRDGWLARSLQVRGQAIDFDNWTLHHLDRDFSESTDVATQQPERLAELVAAFDAAAWANDVYPLDNRALMGKLSDASEWQRALADAPRSYRPGAQSVHRTDILPAVSNRSFRVEVTLRQRDGDEGVLWALGDFIGGMVMYVEGGRLQFHYNGFGDTVDVVPVDLAPGDHRLVLEYEALGGRRGRGRLVVDDGAPGDWIDMSPTLAFGPFEGLDVGLDRRAPVSWRLREQHRTFPYRGCIDAVRVEPGPRAPA
jgi:arylsulfatase A-like enzyme